MMDENKRGTALEAVPAPKDSISLFRAESRKAVKQISTVFPFIYAGKTLMIGRPQTGKSFLQKMIALRMATELKKPILILTEDMRAVAGDQIDIICTAAETGKDGGSNNKYHIDVEEAKKYITIVDQKELAKEQLKYFIDYLRKYGDEFYYIFADRLSLFITGYNNSYEALSQAINNINILLAEMRYNNGIMLTHHERKVDPQQITQQNVNEIFENANGSIAYLASTENHILIRHTAGFNVDIYIEAKLQHDPKKRKKRYSIYEGEGFIKDIKEWDAFDIMSPQQKDIYLAIVHNLEKGIDTDVEGIKDTIGDIDKKTIRTQLKRMIEKGILIKNGEMYQPSDF